MSEAGLVASTALTHEYAEIIASLSADEWAAASLCTGWRVQDLVAHTGSNFKLLVEPPAAAESDEPASSSTPMTAEQQQEALVQDRRAWDAAAVRREFETYQDGALGVMKAVQTDPVAGAPMTMSDLGTYDTHLLADAFAFDLYCHLHVDLLAPTGPVRRSAAAVTDELLSPGIGWMLAGIPQMCLPVGPLLDRPLGLALTGPGGGRWTLQPGQPFPVITVGIDDAAAVVTSAATDFVLWGTKRTDWRPTSTVSGDENYAGAVLDAMNIV